MTPKVIKDNVHPENCPCNFCNPTTKTEQIREEFDWRILENWGDMTVKEAEKLLKYFVIQKLANQREEIVELVKKEKMAEDNIFANNSYINGFNSALDTVLSIISKK